MFEVNFRTRVSIPSPVLGSLRWPNRPDFPEGNDCWTYLIEGDEQYAIAIGHVQNGRPHPFEVWVLSSEQPRCLGAVAKTLSADMRTQDRTWLSLKLEALERVTGNNPVINQPLGNTRLLASSNSSALARVVKYRLNQLGVDDLDENEETPLVDAMLSIKDAGHEGTLSWTASIRNPQTGDDFTLFLPEAEISDGTQRPVAVRFAGRYPRDLDGLAELLTMDMAIVDVAWIGMKLRKLIHYTEPMGSFMAKTPGTGVTERQDSIVAYVARLMIHRYATLGLLTQEGYPVSAMGVMVEVPGDAEAIIQLAA